MFLNISQNLPQKTCVFFLIHFIKTFLRHRNQVLAYQDYIFSFLDIMNDLYIK